MRYIALCLALAGALSTSSSLIAADSEKIPLQLNLKEGETHKVTYSFHVDVADKDGQLRPLKRLDATLNCTVADVDSDGNCSIKVAFEQLRWLSPEMKSDFDSRAPKGSPKNHSAYADAILQLPITYKLSKLGVVSPNPDGRKELVAAWNAVDATGDNVAGFYDSDAVSVMNNVNQFLWGAAFVRFPATPVAVGDSWTVPLEQKKPSAGEMDFKELKYTLHNRVEGTADLDVEMIPAHENAGPRLPLQCMLDKKTGWPQRVTLTLENKTPKATISVLIESDNPHLRERAIAAGLYWLAKHQSSDGSWSLVDYTKQCKDKTCTGRAKAESKTAATALGVLPFLAAGQTHKSGGPFQRVIATGIDLLVKHQKDNGDLARGESSGMYSHGIAALALCEAYGMTHDATLKTPAQKAIRFIEDAQDAKTGGWRYHPGEADDLFVLGWQSSALYSAKLAGLDVKAATLDGERKFLDSVSQKGADGAPTGKFSSRPDAPPTLPMSAIGALAFQRLEGKAVPPMIHGSVDWFTDTKPSPTSERDLYFWYYASQMMHNTDSLNWDAWNRALGETLAAAQQREGCASGSWSPDQPTKERWSELGGRVMETSLACLTLEVYYRYLPTFDDRKFERPKAP